MELEATKISPNPNIENIVPEQRNCYFHHEHPPVHTPKTHKRYSYVRMEVIQEEFEHWVIQFFWQASCILECQIENTLLVMSEKERCMPWYLPPLDSDTRLCSPFEALNFTRYINKMSYDECKVCMILVDYAMKTHVLIFPALPARL